MLDSLLQAIEDWIRELFTGMVNANLTTMFTDVNDKTRRRSQRRLARPRRDGTEAYSA